MTNYANMSDKLQMSRSQGSRRPQRPFEKAPESESEDRRRRPQFRLQPGICSRHQLTTKMKTLYALSFNARGLASRQRRVAARHLLASLRARPDVLCLQEHKLRAGRLNKIPNEVWPRIHWLCAPAAEGLHARRNLGVEAGRGGVPLGIQGDFARYIVKEGITNCTRAVWICVIHPVWGRIGFCGAYGPNSAAERLTLSRSLFFELDPTFKWVLLGDFNMIELPSEQLGSSGGCVAGRERGAWAQLKRKFAFTDTFVPQRGHLSFSWDNLRIHRHNPRNSTQPLGNRLLRRLDRVYLASGNHGANITAQSTILPGIAFSDHAPVWATLSLENAPTRPSCHRMNASHFVHPEFKLRISRMWES